MGFVPKPARLGLLRPPEPPADRRNRSADGMCICTCGSRLTAARSPALSASWGRCGRGLGGDFAWHVLAPNWRHKYDKVCPR